MIDSSKLLDFLGITLFEICMFAFFLMITLLLLILKLNGLILSLTWFNVLLPLFVSDALACYFCLIIFIRQYINGYIKQAFYRAFYSFCQLFLIISFKTSLLHKLDGKNIDNADIFVYCGGLALILCARLCIRH